VSVSPGKGRKVGTKSHKELDVSKMPGHWLLARMGKRVLRPGGLELTMRMLEGLGIGPEDEVVEFAPGLGTTARITLDRNPASYTGVERDEAAARAVQEYLDGPRRECRVGDAEETGLPEESCTVVYGEAMLTMQRPEQKARIVREARRLLKPGGRYGIHELCLVPDGLDEGLKEEIRATLSSVIKVGARPLTPSEWRGLLEYEGFEVEAESVAPMRLLEPGRLVRDEGLPGAARFVSNVLRDPEARRRVLLMRRTFRKYRDHLAAIALVGVKRGREWEKPREIFEDLP
jgi:SAM-dependent methyltransferase